MAHLLGNLKTYSHPHILKITSSKHLFSAYSTLTITYIQDFNCCSNEVFSSVLVEEIKRHILDNSNIKDLVYKTVIRSQRKLIFSYDHSVRYMQKHNGYLEI